MYHRAQKVSGLWVIIDCFPSDQSQESENIVDDDRCHLHRIVAKCTIILFWKSVGPGWSTFSPKFHVPANPLFLELPH